VDNPGSYSSFSDCSPIRQVRFAMEHLRGIIRLQIATLLSSRHCCFQYLPTKERSVATFDSHGAGHIPEIQNGTVCRPKR
jgi:hypothetical protein